MKLIFSTILLACLALASFTASAQKLTKKFSVGFGLEGGLPTGDAKDAFNFTGGLTLRFSYHEGPGFITFAIGGIAFIPKSFEGEDTKAGLQIPFKAGYKYIIGDHFFVMGEVGYSSFKYFYSDEDGNLVSTKDGGFTFAPGAGVQFNALEVGLRYESFSIKGGNISYLGFRVGFNF